MIKYIGISESLISGKSTLLNCLYVENQKFKKFDSSKEMDCKPKV